MLLITPSDRHLETSITFGMLQMSSILLYVVNTKSMDSLPPSLTGQYISACEVYGRNVKYNRLKQVWRHRFHIDLVYFSFDGKYKTIGLPILR